MSEWEEFNKVVSKLFYDGKHYGEIAEQLFDLFNELEEELEEILENEED